MLKFFINNIDYTLDAELETVEAIIGLNRSTTSAGLETTGLAIKLKNDAAALLRTMYIDQCEFPPIVLDATIETDCGSFFFKIAPKDVEWCTDCTAEVDLDSATEEGICFNRLDNEPVVNDDFWQHLIDTKKWDVTPYQRDVSLLGLILAKSINYITFLPQLLLPKAVRTHLRWGLYGSGRFHASFGVLDTMKYYAQRCDRTFRSSILESDPYNKLSILPAPASKGGWFDEQNAPIVEAFDIYTMTWSVKELLDNLGLLFWGEFRLTNTELILEQKDYYIANAVNLGELNPLNDYCVKPYVHNCASRSFEYSRDALDDAGDSDMSLYNYFHKFDFDNVALTEPCKNTVGSSIAVNSSSPSVDSIVLRLRNEGTGELRGFELFTRKGMLLAKHRAALPKFFISRQVGINPGGFRIVIQDSRNYGGRGFLQVPKEIANPDLSFDPEVEGNLYDRFHFKQDPANGFLPCKTVDSIDVCFDCDIVTAMRAAFVNGSTCYFTSEHGNMYFTEANVSIGENDRVTINDIEIYPNL